MVIKEEILPPCQFFYDYDEDYAVYSRICNKPAKYFICDPIDSSVCEEHICRCFPNGKELTRKQLDKLIEKYGVAEYE